jgi:hypothetical protein
MAITSGVCQHASVASSSTGGRHGDSMDTDSNKLVPIFDDETEVTVRILPDRAVADFRARWALGGNTRLARAGIEESIGQQRDALVEHQWRGRSG